MSHLQQQRLIFDISMLVQSDGRLSGMLRVLRELAAWAHSHRADVLIVIHDPESNKLRHVRPEWIALLLQGRLTIDFSGRRRLVNGRYRIRDRLPSPLREMMLWLLAPRRRTVIALESIRLAVPNGMHRLVERLQILIASRRFQKQMFDRHGCRKVLLSHELALGPICQPGTGDIVVFGGMGWQSLDPAELRLMKSRKAKIATLCHDIMPILLPGFVTPATGCEFRRRFNELLRTADLVLVASRSVERDVRHYCLAQDQEIAKMGMVRFGSDLRCLNAASSSSLPPGLEAERYAIFVSNLAPHKGHRLLFNVWKRLLAAGTPQAQRFKLVFVGSAGWLVDDLLTELRTDRCVGDTLLVLSDIEDDTLAVLYARAAFCLYPSQYEGYGLPVVEGFGHGKAVIASNGGSLPELVGDFSPCLDARDEQAWYEMMKLWIEHPSARAPFEAAIRERYQPTTWPEAVEDFFRVIDRELR